MTQTVIDILSWILLTAGGGFVLVGGIGALRMPNLYTRMHAASVTDTMGAALVLAGVMLGSALLVVLGRDIIRSALSLILSFAALAGIYGLLGSAFLAISQVLTYVGAVAVLILGIWPAPLIEVMDVSIENLVQHIAVTKI